MRRREKDEPQTLGDRFAAGVCSAFAMLLTLALGSAFGDAHRSSAAGAAGGLIERYFDSGPFVVWGGVLIVTAFAAGWVLGPQRMADLWGHMWGTQEPRSPWITIALWLGVTAIVVLCSVFR